MHLVIFDSRLTFDDNSNSVLNNINKRVGLFRKLQNTSSRLAIMTIYKAFKRPYLESWLSS